MHRPAGTDTLKLIKTSQFQGPLNITCYLQSLLQSHTYCVEFNIPRQDRPSLAAGLFLFGAAWSQPFFMVSTVFGTLTHYSTRDRHTCRGSYTCRWLRPAAYLCCRLHVRPRQRCGGCVLMIPLHCPVGTRTRLQAVASQGCHKACKSDDGCRTSYSSSLGQPEDPDPCLFVSLSPIVPGPW